ncbi:hypothetical protein DEJ23_14175 [Curtobacterium sp. MCSS17_008]|uniref:mannosyltransferase family protein n=1 Tax=Curtobacterium sp. MCSS17_008 TaxID=2175647 RepID=UPI000DAABCC4|nr:mannosyltransferase family protein [Curtobacterium sp. MCSS17_008]PZF53840.1 hypothetical protein DEJ23_14175 [Curtobacterium sp. MCSS17_008]
MTDVAEPSRASRPGLPSRVRHLLTDGRAARHTGWTAPLAVWLASRAVSTVLLLTVWLLARANGWPFASYRREGTFWSFLGSWDASFYRTIAEHGYPTALPLDADGHVLPNVWAFLPVFPALARVVQPVVGGSFWAAGVLVATLAGAGACVLLWRLVRAVSDDRRATRATALFAFAPTGFLLQVAYAESTFLLLLFGALLALVRRRYWLVLPLGLVAAFTKPGVLALAVALAVHLVVRIVQERRALPTRDAVAIVVAGLAIAAAGLAWPVVASAVTGRPDAYLETELSWWVGFVGRQDFAPLTPWFTMASTWLGALGVVLVVVVLAGAVWLWTRRGVLALGADVVAFTAAYALYLVAVFLPQQSLPRLLMPTAPLLGADVFTGTRRRTMVWLAVGVCLQPVAIVLLWFLGYP